MAKKTRAHRKWALDYDYLHKLSDEEREWLEKFNDEYYRNEFSDEPLHQEGDERRLLYEENNAANRCIMNADPKKVLAHRNAIPAHRPSIKSRFYFEKDYCLNSNSPEDLIVELIDENQKAISNVINLADYLRIFRRAS